MMLGVRWRRHLLHIRSLTALTSLLLLSNVLLCGCGGGPKAKAKEPRGLRAVGEVKCDLCTSSSTPAPIME